MVEKAAIARSKGRPRLDQAPAIEAAIRKAAMAVLVEQGEAATVQAVAQAAGLSRKTLYARYPTRELLFGAVIRDLLRNIRPLQFEHHPAPADSVASYIDAMLGALVRPDALAVQRLLAADLKGDTELKAALIEGSRTMFVEPLVVLITQGVANGSFAVADPAWAAGAILRLVVSEVIAGSERGEFLRDADERRARGRMLADLVLHGIVAGPA
ncbi:MAG: TetR family transcriptional regulator [Sphingomonadales bacterium]|nr:TetR family transcriptional regulator [Sphingomonadales bacterium]